MRFTIILLILSVLHANGSDVYSQKTRLSINFSDTKLVIVLDKIEVESDFFFLYNEKLLDTDRKVSIDAKDQLIDVILGNLFTGTDVKYTIIDRKIILAPGYLSKEPSGEISLQQKSVTGTITDATSGDPMPGVNVLVKGTTIGTLSDGNGKYTISVPNPDNNILVFSFIGYSAIEVPIAGKLIINQTLTATITGLDEVVVIGYGSIKRKDLTGSVGSVDNSVIMEAKSINATDALLGKVAGVQVKPVSGQPGATTQIRIRGVGSISAGAGPLYIVDGFPVSDIQTLSPNDIENMDILKDASATAIYGSRGSNGVIIITTKRGKEGKPTITYDTYFGIQEVSLKPVMMNAREEAQYFHDGVMNRNKDAGNNVSGPAISWKLPVPQIILDVLDGTNTTDIEWIPLVLRRAPQQQHQLSITGGGQNLKYALSGEYLDQEGIIISTFYKRYSLRANIDAQVSKKLTVKLNFNPSYTDENIVQASGTTSGPNENVLGSAMAVTPFYPVWADDGNYFTYQGLAACGNFYHPIALVRELKNPQTGMRLMGNINTEYKIFDQLKLNILLGVDLRSIHSSKFKPLLPAFQNEVSYGWDRTNLDKNLLAEYTLNYAKSFNKHNISGVVGYTTQKDVYNANYVYSDRFPNNLVPTLSAVGGLVTNGTSTVDEWSMVSYLARANYDFNGKYFVTASIRTDGSSRFGSERKYGIFPSAAIAWRISDENFFKNISFISDMKLRASYGETGNNNIGNYESIGTVVYENYALGGTAVGGYATGRLANPFLTWEKQQQFNAGVNAGFLKSRINVTVDYFRSTNTSLLLNVNTPAITGFNSALKNIGQVRNTGWEFVLSTANLKGKFEWSTDFNISTYQNEVLKLGPSGDPIITTGNITMIGQPIGMFYGWLTDGIFMNQEELDKGPIYAPGTAAASHMGDVRFVDVSGPDGVPDGIINTLDKTIMGSPYPDFYYGMTNRFAYNNLSLTISFQGSQGAEILNRTRNASNISTRARTNQLALSNNYWKSPEEPGDGKTPRPNDAPTGNIRGEDSQRELDNGSYLRVNNITLSYVLKDVITQKIKLSSVRIYINATNPFIITKYTAWNPDSSNSESSLTPGIDLNDYPLAKSISLGLNVSF